MTPIVKFIDPGPPVPDARCGHLIAFDVGVGKIFTAIAMIALARAQGVRRPVILVPRSIQCAWNVKP